MGSAVILLPYKNTDDSYYNHIVSFINMGINFILYTVIHIFTKALNLYFQIFADN